MPENTTRSLCPVCLITLPARMEHRGDEVYLSRTCPDHGPCEEVIWRGTPSFASWRRPKPEAFHLSRQTKNRRGCPHDCGRCPEHGQHACTVLFEITGQCNLHCPVCFADSGGESAPFAPLPLLLEQLHWIRKHAGPVVLQLSGGEPTLHPDLAALVRAGSDLFPAVQLNTNGLLLAQRPELARQLADAGLSWVFLQFDGTTDDICTVLRGRPLLRQKLAAVEHCRAAGLAVVLVPTLVPGVNDKDLGNLLRLALSLAPTVRGLHLQPVTTSGRNIPAAQRVRNIAANAPAETRARLTLPEVLTAVSLQSGGLVKPEHATPPGCEHERCSFHCRYRMTESGALIPLRGESCCGSLPDDGGRQTPSLCSSRTEREGVNKAIDTVLRSWQAPDRGPGDKPGERDAQLAGNADPGGIPDAFEAFIAKTRASTFSITCMAFQDAHTVDLERLRGCCVHVFVPPDRLIPFCSYNLTADDGTPLHRLGSQRTSVTPKEHA